MTIPRKCPERKFGECLGLECGWWNPTHGGCGVEVLGTDLTHLSNVTRESTRLMVTTLDELIRILKKDQKLAKRLPPRKDARTIRSKLKRREATREAHE